MSFNATHGRGGIAAFVSCSLLSMLGCLESDDETVAVSDVVQAEVSASAIPLDRIQITMEGDHERAIRPSKYRDECLEKHDLTGVNHLDQPVRVFRDHLNKLHIVASNNLNLQFTASNFSFDDIRQHCRPVIDDHKELYTLEMPKPEKFMSREWLLSTYTTNGRIVYGYVHNELHGEKYEPLRPECDSPGKECWYASITKYISTDGGMHFEPLVLPGDRTHLLMASVHKFHPFKPGPDGTRIATGKAGIAGHTNVFRGPDGAYYMFANRVELNDRIQKRGACLLRSDDLVTWSSWQGEGKGYARNLVDPYTSSSDPKSRGCAVVSEDRFHSVTYHPGLKMYIALGVMNSRDRGRGFSYRLSRDLVTWTAPVYLRKQLSMDGGVLIDHDSPSRNFDVTGDRPFLYFGGFCGQGPGNAAHCVKRQRMRISIIAAD